MLGFINSDFFLASLLEAAKSSRTAMGSEQLTLTYFFIVTFLYIGKLDTLDVGGLSSRETWQVQFEKHGADAILHSHRSLHLHVLADGTTLRRPWLLCYCCHQESQTNLSKFLSF